MTDLKSVVWAIDAICLGEMSAIINGFKDHKEGNQYAPYIKFLLIINGIEFLGACLDELPFDKEKKSEDRFNRALKELFPGNYLKYAKKNNNVYFYRDLRCSMVHQLRPRKIAFTTKYEAKIDSSIHLGTCTNDDGREFLVLILEDFYDDFRYACEALKKRITSGKITNPKINSSFISVFTGEIKNNK